MESVRVAAALENTACLLVNYLYLVVHHHILHVALKHGVGLKQLGDGMHSLRLQGIIRKQGGLLSLFLLGSEVLLLQLGYLISDIGKDEELLVGYTGGYKVVALVSHLHTPILLLYDKIKVISNQMHLAVVVLHVEILGLLQELLHARLGEELDQRIVLGKSLVGSQKHLGSLGLIAFGDQLLGLGKLLGHKLLLGIVQPFHIRLELHELLVIPSGHRSGYNQRRTGIVNQHGVHLVDYGVMVLALHKVVLVDGHVVTQVVETELVVGSECNVRTVSCAAGSGVGLMLVDAVHSQAVELVQRPHPLGVTLGQVVVDRHHMHSLACQRIEKYGEGRHQGLSLTGGHLGYLSLMQDDTSDELHVIVDHVPCGRVPSGHPCMAPVCLVPLYADIVVLGAELAVHIGGSHLDDFLFLEPAGGGLHHRESIGQHLVQNLLYLLVYLLGQLVHLSGQGLLLVNRDSHILQLGPERFLLCLISGNSVLYDFSYPVRLTSKFIIRKPVYTVIGSQHLCQYRLNLLHVPLGLGAEHLFQ